MNSSPDFKDLFSKQASQYARYRPTYPVLLFKYLASLVEEHHLAWDCGTGSGQAAVLLTPHFERVLATDPSAKQISSASRHPKIEYRMGSAENPAIGALADPGPGGDHRIRNVLIGAGAGSIIGAAAGYLIHQGNQSSQEEGYAQGKDSAKKDLEAQANPPDGRSPKLIPAKTEARWVPDLVRGTTFIPGHFEYQIVEGARWEH